MRIGILTYHNPCNFGANLQAYTSSRYFESLGHTVKVINLILDGGKPTPRCQESQNAAHHHFSQEVLKVTRPVSTGEEILQVVKEEQFDVIAIGADAVWNKKNRKRLEIFYAQWLWGTELEGKIRVIALSPAFMGNDYHDLTSTERESFRNALLKFHSINVRDTWTRDAVNRDIMGSDYIKTLNPDPVFLLHSFCDEEWQHDASQITSKQYYAVSLPKGFSQQLGSYKNQWLRKLKAEVNARGCKLVELPIPEGYSGLDGFDYIVKYPIDPLQWFLWLKNAKGFIGLRFHAVVSCISCGTPFYSFDSYSNLPKWQHYLNLLGYHKSDRSWAYKSKIRNLLEGSGLESYRRNGSQVFGLSPRKIVEKLESQSEAQILAFRDERIATFKSNMEAALKE